MNSRQIAFLRLLLEHEEYLPVGFYAGRMDVSDKTLRRMIHGVNEILTSYNGVIESRPGTGIRLEINEEERERLMTVSYTHLDVYKRQEISWYTVTPIY